ncbi:MAG TPA: ABC transporter permease [Myxococcota bacterium]|nr:ABC transporter permease [Myxococcota bacterium]
MKAGLVIAVAGRLARQLVRDKRACALIILAPVLIMFLFAVLLRSEDTPPRVAIVVSGTAALFTTELEQLLVEPDEEGQGFDLVMIEDGTNPQDALKRKLVDAVLVVPRTFVEDRASGKRSRLDLYVEGADPMRTAEIFSRFRKAVPDSLSGIPTFLPSDCDAHCAETIADGPPKIELNRVYGGDIDDSMDFFTPVLPPFFAFFFVFLLSGMSFLRERVGGTAERLLASPLSRADLVGGYILGFLPAALVQAGLVILFARFFIGGPWGGWPAIVAIILLSLAAECLGVFVSAFARSEFQVFQFIPIVILPQILLCGIIWPITNLPGWLRAISYCMPLTYAVDAIRDAAIRGLGFAAIWPNLLILLGFVVVGAALAALSVRRSI